MSDLFSNCSTIQKHELVVHIPYRTCEPQTFRRNELINLLDNLKTHFTNNNITYKVVICEQLGFYFFNRGKLLNIAFIESEKLFHFPKKYLHMNSDYYFDLNKKIPNEIFDFDKGFLELFNVLLKETTNNLVLGSSCLFDDESYTTINGYPNDLEGWGGDDWAILKRVKEKNVKIHGMLNESYIFEIEQPEYNKVSFNNTKNIDLSKRDDTDTNGVNSCNYDIDSFGEFHDGDIVHHFVLLL